ncbi:MAG: ThiF family adenylyltransferase, partial [bacterium]|nr:ThiF family adenylyltransferase [bacterium]
KVDIMAERVKQINPQAVVYPKQLFYRPGMDNDPLHAKLDYVIDAVDNVPAKLGIIMRCTELGVKVISSMGTANKLDPCRFEITDISKTSVCPLAKVVRLELRKRGVESGVKVLYSREQPIPPRRRASPLGTTSQINGSIAFVPSVAGLIIASTVVRDLLGIK